MKWAPRICLEQVFVQNIFGYGPLVSIKSAVWEHYGFPKTTDKDGWIGWKATIDVGSVPLWSRSTLNIPVHLKRHQPSVNIVKKMWRKKFKKKKLSAVKLIAKMLRLHGYLFFVFCLREYLFLSTFVNVLLTFVVRIDAAVSKTLRMTLSHVQ